MFRKRHCPHSNLRAIHGDEVNYTPGYRRLECRDCRALLDGPVVLASLRRDEAFLVRADGGR